MHKRPSLKGSSGLEKQALALAKYHDPFVRLRLQVDHPGRTRYIAREFEAAMSGYRRIKGSLSPGLKGAQDTSVSQIVS